MIISWETFQGLCITVYSIVLAAKVLLSRGVEYVFSERFCLYSPEGYFCDHKKLERRSDNPDIAQFGYNNKTIHVQTQVFYTSGNNRGVVDTTVIMM